MSSFRNAITNEGHIKKQVFSGGTWTGILFAVDAEKSSRPIPGNCFVFGVRVVWGCERRWQMSARSIINILNPHLLEGVIISRTEQYYGPCKSPGPRPIRPIIYISNGAETIPTDGFNTAITVAAPSNTRHTCMINLYWFVDPYFMHSSVSMRILKFYTRPMKDESRTFKWICVLCDSLFLGDGYFWQDSNSR